VTLLWEQRSGPGTAHFGNTTTASTVVTFDSPGDYVLRLTANDGDVTPSFGELTVTVKLAGTANDAPHVSAGGNQTITLPADATLNGVVTDDGLPNPPGTVTIGWTQVSGPGAVTFGNAAQAITVAQFPTAGTYVLRLTANDGQFSAQNDATITV